MWAEFEGDKLGGSKSDQRATAVVQVGDDEAPNQGQQCEAKRKGEPWEGFIMSKM